MFLVCYVLPGRIYSAFIYFLLSTYWLYFHSLVFVFKFHCLPLVVDVVWAVSLYTLWKSDSSLSPNNLHFLICSEFPFGKQNKLKNLFLAGWLLTSESALKKLQKTKRFWIAIIIQDTKCIHVNLPIQILFINNNLFLQNHVKFLLLFVSLQLTYIF